MSAQAVNESLTQLQQSAQRWLGPLMARLVAVPPLRWQILLIALLSLLMLSDMARLVWFALPSHTAPLVSVTPVNVTATTSNKSAQAVDIEKVAGWHLFGEVGAQPRVAATAVEEQAQETTLNLQLLGVIAASEPTQARAFILADGRQQQYTVGEQIPGPGKVVLSKVLVDRAIIDNNGRHETLWLYDPNASSRLQSSSPTAAPSSTVDMRDNSAVTQLAQGYRERLYQNPGSLADLIQVTPASENGKLIGYRVNPGRDPAQFSKVGLRPGDIVTMINDVKLDDPQRALELYNLLRTETEAAITVRRGNEDVVLMVSLQNSGNAD
ncbi:MAG TPA: type II secretion system protein GspC [Spongiibacteraceae bacterium]|nr:type II secretion system protein GspC [Spongiibacteraceae bacterium]